MTRRAIWSQHANRLVSVEDLETAIGQYGTSKEAYMPVVDGKDLRVFGEVRCPEPGLAGLRALRVAERGELKLRGGPGA